MPLAMENGKAPMVEGENHAALGGVALASIKSLKRNSSDTQY